MNKETFGALWLRWVIANSLGEMIGLGLTFAVGIGLISNLGEQNSVLIIVTAFLVAALSGAIEATIVSLSQWWAMHPWFPSISRKTWWSATLAGALVAYVMGYLPSTVMSLAEQSAESQVNPSVPAQWVVLLLAAMLGLAGGAVLSFAQWLTMRGKLRGSSIWIPANMLAWMAGMPLIFWSIDVAQGIDNFLLIILFVAVMLLVTGALVGAIHGFFLIQLARLNPSPSYATGSIIASP